MTNPDGSNGGLALYPQDTLLTLSIEQVGANSSLLTAPNGDEFFAQQVSLATFGGHMVSDPKSSANFYVLRSFVNGFLLLDVVNNGRTTGEEYFATLVSTSGN